MCWRYRGYPLQQSEFDRTASAIVCFWSALLSFRQLRWWKSQSANCRRTIILGNTFWQFQRFLNCKFADCLDSSCCFRIHGHEMTLSGWHWHTTGSQTSYLQHCMANTCLCSSARQVLVVGRVLVKNPVFIKYKYFDIFRVFQKSFENYDEKPKFGYL